MWIPLKNIPLSLIVSFPKSKQDLQPKHTSLLMFPRFSLFPPNAFQHLRGRFNGWIDNMDLMDSGAHLKWETVFIYVALGSLKDILFAWRKCFAAMFSNLTVMSDMTRLHLQLSKPWCLLTWTLRWKMPRAAFDTSVNLITIKHDREKGTFTQHEIYNSVPPASCAVIAHGGHMTCSAKWA